MPGSLGHLTRRFFDVLTARRLDVVERETVTAWLDEPSSALFFAQPPADQRHGLEAALVVVGAGVSDLTVIRAALLHDVGKRHSGLGVIGRVWASLLIRSRLPLPRRARLYRDHGEIAARELAAAGCEGPVVEFARHHHDSRPPDVAEETWELLQLADEPRKARNRKPPGISWPAPK